jgi:hypothetical protein
LSERTLAAAAAGAAAAVLAACATPSPLPAPRSLSIAIQGGKVAEECFRLDAGERVDFEFQANGPLEFNLHTHRGDQLVTPVEAKRTRAQSGTYVSPRAEDYCLMWTNEGGTPVQVTGSWRRRPP